jgi:hypothetical protein
VDPSNPTADAVAIAGQLARVVARDLSQQPAWLQPQGGAPNLAWDTQFCGNCHQQEYAAWSKSVHAHAADDPMVTYCVGVEQQLQGPQFARLCAGCHDPVSARAGDSTFQTKRGITCIGCHDVTGELRAGGNADLEATSHDWTADHKAWALASLEKLRQPEFCGGCHQQFVSGSGLTAISTLGEFHASPYSGTVRCIDCHMQKQDHHFPGGNLYLGKMFGDDALVAAQTSNVTHAVVLSPVRIAGGILVTVTNDGAGHGFPTGVTDIREPWVEVDAKDASGNVLARFGGPDASGLIPPGAARLGIDIAAEDGTELFRHELSKTTRIPFDVRVPAGRAQPMFVPLPATLPQTTASLDAVLYYRNVRTTYYRAATGDARGSAPDIEVARKIVP